MSTTANNARPSIVPTRGLSAALDFACVSHGRAAVLLIIFCAIAFLPGFFRMPPVDRDEARFAQATKQMVESGGYIDIRFQDEVRYKKPVGIYWLQAAAVEAGRALGVPDADTTIWLYRLPSFAGATSAVLLTYWAALAFVGGRAALLSALMMGSALVLSVEARLATTDAVLLACSVAAMGALARVYLAQRRSPPAPADWKQPAILWTALALGILIKGPMVPMFVALAAITLSILDRSARWLKALRPLSGFIWLLLIVLPWFIAIVLRSGDSFFAQAVGHDMLGKVAGAQESHGAPPGYYLLLYWVTFWPGSVLTGLAVPAVWRARRDSATQFLLAWLIPSWLIFEAVPTKLPHYVMPLYPAIAILIAGVMEDGKLFTGRWLTRGTAGWFVFPALVAVAGPVLFVILGNGLGLIAWPFAAAAAIFGLFAWWLYEADGAERSLLRGVAASVFVAIAIYALTFPRLPALFPSASVAANLRASGCAAPRLVSSYSYQEPSLVFLAGTETRFTDGAGAAEFLRLGACRFALIDARSERGFVQRAEATGLRYTLAGRIDGYNISSGKPVALKMFRSAS